jgi:hypothetical protein
MNRPRKKDRHLPACVHFRHGAYYYVKGAKWRPLGKDLRSALAQYATFMEAPEGSMPKLIWTVLDHLRPKLKPATVAQYTVAAKKLAVALVEFNPAGREAARRGRDQGRHVGAPEHGEPVPVVPAPGLRLRARARPGGQQSRHRGEAPRREEAHAAAIPGRVRCHLRAGRRAECRSVMELLRFTGQRVVDVLQIRESAILAEGIRFRQQKTDAYLTVKWTPGLTAAVARARALQGNVRTLTLLTNSLAQGAGLSQRAGSVGGGCARRLASRTRICTTCARCPPHGLAARA